MKKKLLFRGVQNIIVHFCAHSVIFTLAKFFQNICLCIYIK